MNEQVENRLAFDHGRGRQSTDVRREIGSRGQSFGGQLPPLIGFATCWTLNLKPMTTSKPSRIFDSGPAKTLYLTIPAQVVSDSQFPFEADDHVRVTIDGDRLIATPQEGSTG